MIKQKLILKFISLFLVLVTILMLFTGCGYELYYGHDLKKYGDTTHIGTVVCAIKSKNSEFNVDEAEIEIFYGNIEELKINEDEEFEFISYAIYFVNALNDKDRILKMGIRGGSAYQYKVNDYKNIEGYYLIKELTFEEFSSDEYTAKIRTFSYPKISHHENFTIPPEVFEGERGTLYFIITPIYASRSSEGYYIGEDRYGFGKIEIDYKYVDSKTIELIKYAGYYDKSK